MNERVRIPHKREKITAFPPVRNETLQRSPFAPAEQAVNEAPPIVQDVLSSSGQPLNTDTQNFMESRFGHDFSKVRVHTDEKAVESAQAVDALAYTVGNDVVFGQGQNKQETSEGKQLLAHELTHVVQQRNASVSRPLIVGPTNDSYEQKANDIGATGALTTSVNPQLAGETVSLQRLQRQTDNPQQDGGDQPDDNIAAFWENSHGDDMIRQVKDDLAVWNVFKLHPDSADNIPGKRAQEAITNFTQPIGIPQLALLKDYATTKLTNDEIIALTDILSFSNGTVCMNATDLFNVQYLDPGHQYTLTIKAKDSVSVPMSAGTKVASWLGTSVQIQYQNALDMSWTKTLEVVGISYGFSWEVKGGGEGVWDEVKDLAKGGFLKGLGNKLMKYSSEGFSEGFGEGVKEGLSPEEQSKKLAPEAGVGLLGIELSKEGVKAESPGRYWGFNDVEGPVRTAQFLNNEIKTSTGAEASYKGINAVEFMGSKGWSTNLTFPEIGLAEASITPPDQKEDLIPTVKEIKVTLLEVGGGIAISDN